MKFKSPLHETVSTTPTEFWNDSCSVPELTYAIEHGATGATSNPFIVFTVLKGALGEWKDRLLSDPTRIRQVATRSLAARRRSLADVLGAKLTVDEIWLGPPVSSPVVIRIYGDDYGRLRSCV